MVPFRDKTPARRAIVTKVSRWGEHKPDLKIDFNNHCAYCHSFDGFRHTWFEVDHFVPKDFFIPLGNITLTQYDNLVYSCKFCNNNKLNKWPSLSETIYNNGIIGFEDPCSINYMNHFYRDATGAIMWATPVGKWMHTEAFKFDQRERGIRLLWNLKRLRDLIRDLKKVLEKMDPGTDNFKKLKQSMLDFTYEYFQYNDTLMEYYDSL